MLDRYKADVRQAKGVVSRFQKQGARRERGRTTAQGSAWEMPLQTSSQATEKLEKYNIGGASIWPGQGRSPGFFKLLFCVGSFLTEMTEITFLIPGSFLFFSV